ncbi:MAG TPA: hypothetical protein VI455_12385 [Terriglobia bacterium]
MTGTAGARKSQLLRKSGYAYNFNRMVYFNRQAKKAFSVEFVEDHSASYLQRYIKKTEREPGWHFYFNGRDLPTAVRRELEGALG